MTKHLIQIPITDEEFDWILTKAGHCDPDTLANLEDRLLEKVRSIRETGRLFHYQEQLLDNVRRIAQMYLDEEFRNSLEPLHRSLAAFALCYFLDSADLTPDFQPFTGYHDDFVIISVVCDLLKTHIDRREAAAPLHALSAE